MAPYFPGTALYPGTALWPEYNGETQPTITASTAVLTGRNTVAFSGTTVPSSSLQTYWWFEWGQKGSGAYGSESPVARGIAGTAGTASVSHTQENFPGGDYQYRLTAWNSAGTASATAGTFNIPDLVSGNIQTSGAVVDGFTHEGKLGGSILLSGDIRHPPDRTSGTITFSGAVVDEHSREEELGGTITVSGDVWENYYKPISELAFRRGFIHEAQRVQ